jgi:PAS domain S-box-containing protein
MQPAEDRRNEAATLEALRSLEVLDTAHEAEFNALVQAASLACGAPISLISLVDADRQWFKANLGLPEVSETPREVSFCAHAVLGDGLFVVPDSSLDPRFADNPLVTGDPNIRFYAGAPIVVSGGHRIGTLCVIDRLPRELDASQRAILQRLALAAGNALEGRRSTRELRRSKSFLDRTGRVAGVGGWELDLATDELTWSDETRRIHGVEPEYKPVLAEAIDFYAAEARPVIRAAVEHAVSTGEGWDLELPLVRRDGRRIWVRAVGSVDADAGKPVRLVGAFQDITRRKELDLQLAAASARVLDLYDNAPCGYHSLDDQGRFLHINATALGWLG